jgi:hypothetical protein
VKLEPPAVHPVPHAVAVTRAPPPGTVTLNRATLLELYYVIIYRFNKCNAFVSVSRELANFV